MLGTLKNVSDLNSFNPKVRDLLTKVAHQDSESPKMYKTGVLKLVESRNLYGLVQCTGDLSGNDCTKCLDGAIKQQPDCCDGKQGGRVITGSCNMRYIFTNFSKIETGKLFPEFRYHLYTIFNKVFQEYIMVIPNYTWELECHMHP